jgi:hypothetical protein
MLLKFGECILRFKSLLFFHLAAAAAPLDLLMSFDRKPWRTRGKNLSPALESISEVRLRILFVYLLKANGMFFTIF